MDVLSGLGQLFTIIPSSLGSSSKKKVSIDNTPDKPLPPPVPRPPPPPPPPPPVRPPPPIPPPRLSPTRDIPNLNMSQKKPTIFAPSKTHRIFFIAELLQPYYGSHPEHHFA